MSEGYIKLWRSALENGWLKNHKVWVFWSYCMLKATYRPRRVVHGYQQIDLEPGQFIFGRNQAAKETGLSVQEVRTCKAFLEKAGNLTSKTTNKFSIITLVKWCFYQIEADETTSKSTHAQPASNHKQEYKEGKEEKKTPAVLLAGYVGEEKALIENTLQAIATTRKAGKIADTVKASILQRFEKHDRQQVLTGCRAYLEKKYHLDGKTEKYLFGIIRNSAAQTPEPAPGFITTGSRLLDEAYRKQAQGTA
jgi:hypothetical protein